MPTFNKKQCNPFCHKTNVHESQSLHCCCCFDGCFFSKLLHVIVVTVIERDTPLSKLKIWILETRSNSCSKLWCIMLRFHQCRFHSSPATTIALNNEPTIQPEGLWTKQGRQAQGRSMPYLQRLGTRASKSPHPHNFLLKVVKLKDVPQRWNERHHTWAWLLKKWIAAANVR